MTTNDRLHPWYCHPLGTMPTTETMDGAVGGYGNRYLHEFDKFRCIDVDYVVIDLAESPNHRYHESGTFRYAIEIVTAEHNFATDESEYDYEGFPFAYESFEEADRVARSLAVGEAWKFNSSEAF